LSLCGRRSLEMPDWMLGFLSATVLAIFGWVLTWMQRKAQGIDEQREAVAALRFELQSNLGDLADVLKTHNYFRDEAWVILKNKGYISYLHKPIPMKVIKVYNQLHGLNDRIRVLKEKVHEPDKSTINSEAEGLKTELGDSIRLLISLLDAQYPKIGRNFEETPCEPKDSVIDLVLKAES
jgi:hypothetical protein